MVAGLIVLILILGAVIYLVARWGKVVWDFLWNKQEKALEDFEAFMQAEEEQKEPPKTETSEHTREELTPTPQEPPKIGMEEATNGTEEGRRKLSV